MEYGGETFSRYEVAAYRPGSGRTPGRLGEVRSPELFETVYRLPRHRLFGLEEVLGEDGWLKAGKLDEYAPRRARAQALQQAL